MENQTYVMDGGIREHSPEGARPGLFDFQLKTSVEDY